MSVCSCTTLESIGSPCCNNPGNDSIGSDYSNSNTLAMKSQAKTLVSKLKSLAGPDKIYRRIPQSAENVEKSAKGSLSAAQEVDERFSDSKDDQRGGSNARDMTSLQRRVSYAREMTGVPAKVAKGGEVFEAFADELQKSPHFASLAERDLDATISTWDRYYYKLENSIAADPNVRFYILGALSGVLCFSLTIVWLCITDPRDSDREGTTTFGGASFMAVQVFVTGGYDASIVHTDERIIFMCMLWTGVLIFSILIGLITDALTTYMQSLTAGSTKVVENGHTLIL